MSETLEKTVWWKHPALKWFLVGVCLLFTGYLVVLMYAQGEYLFAMLTLVLLGSGIYVFSNRKTYVWRYTYPGIAGIGLFILFPLICTIAIAFTNYSSTNQLTFKRAQAVLMSRHYQTGEPFNFKLYPVSGQWVLALNAADSENSLISEPFVLTGSEEIILPLHEQKSEFTGDAATLRTITQYRQALGQLAAILPDGRTLRMSSLRQFSAINPLYSLDKEGMTLTDKQTGTTYRPNMDTGFYQSINAEGEWAKETLSPGFTVSIGWKNFLRVVQDEGIQKPFLSIFIWTMVFSLLTVVLTVALGMVLACIVQWEAIKGRAIYRVLLILPYAVPSFISILIFKGLFNQSFGEINLVLNGLFGLKPDWFTDPALARTMLIIVNTWLGYPYMMILCMGLLKSIPDDLYEASALDGAGPWRNFTKITFPLLIKPLTPLMIASFAFNFNNFVLIQLLTNGKPDHIGTTTPAGHTDLLVNYTYRIAFEGGGGQDFGLAAAIATLIFLLVGALAIINLKTTRIKFD